MNPKTTPKHNVSNITFYFLFFIFPHFSHQPNRKGVEHKHFKRFAESKLYNEIVKYLDQSSEDRENHIEIDDLKKKKIGVKILKYRERKREIARERDLEIGGSGCISRSERVEKSLGVLARRFRHCKTLLFFSTSFSLPSLTIQQIYGNGMKTLTPWLFFTGRRKNGSGNFVIFCWSDGPLTLMGFYSSFFLFHFYFEREKWASTLL